MSRVLFVALLFIAPHVGAQSVTTQQERTISLDKFDSCGFVSRFSPNKIAKECFQSLSNAVLDKDFSILRRNGYALYNATPCTGSKQIRGLWPFYATDGSQYIVIQSSGSMFYSKADGTCTPISGLSGLSLTANMSCVQGLGYLWCSNGTDTPFRTNIASSTSIVTAPFGKYVGFFRNRIVMSGVPGSLTNVYLSGELDGTDWTIPGIILSTSPAIVRINGVNDGLGVKCLLGEFQNNYYIGRDYDLWALAGYDNRDFTLRQVDSQIGCFEPNSPRLVNNQLNWMSHRGIEGLVGTQIQWLSYPIDPTIQTIISAAGNSQAQTFTSQADWQGGNLTASGAGAPISATIYPGNIVPSSWSATVAFSSKSWVQTDVDTNVVPSGSFDTFSAGNLAKWTTSAGNWTTQVVGASTGMVPAAGDSFPEIYMPNTISTGVWSFVFLATNTSQTQFLQFYPICITSSLCNGAATTSLVLTLNNPNSILQYRYSGTNYPVGSGQTLNYFDGNQHVFRITLSTSNFATVAMDGNLIVSTQIPANINFAGNGRSAFVATDGYGAFATNVYLPKFYETQVSTGYDTGLSTPTFGPISVAISSSASSPIQFFTSISSSANGVWSSSVSVNAQLNPQNSPRKEFVRYQVRMYPPAASPIESIGTSVTLSAETTAYYITSCITAVGNTGWGNLDVNAVTNGGSFSFWMSTSGVSCAQATNPTAANWSAVTANSVIPIAVASYTAVRALFTLDVATQVPTINDIAVNWNSGASRPPVASAAYQNKYFVFYTTSQAVGAANDHAVIFDQNGHWQLFDDIKAASAALYLNSLYLGDSQDTGSIYLFDSGSSDNSNPYTFSFTTPDIDDGDPVAPKQFSRAYLLIQAPTVTTAGESLNCSYTLNGSTSTYSLGSISLSEAGSQQGYFVAKLPFPASQPTTANWLNMSCQNNGTNGPIRIYGIRIVYTPASWP